MRTYTKKEYLEYGLKEEHLITDQVWGKWDTVAWPFNIFCDCIYYWIDRTEETWQAYEDCKNCFGRGVPPIPWEELN